MLEYASMRLTLVCATPTTVPRIMVATASTAMTCDHPATISGPQLPLSGSKAERNTRANAAKAAVFTPVDMNAVTAGGAPSYASGVHMWNGTAETLNANPTRTSPTASSCIGDGEIDCAAI